MYGCKGLQAFHPLYFIPCMLVLVPSHFLAIHGESLPMAVKELLWRNNEEVTVLKPVVCTIRVYTYTSISLYNVRPLCNI